jgi:hypothetical protein
MVRGDAHGVVCDGLPGARSDWTECVAVGSQERVEALAESVVVGKTATIPAVESPRVTVGDGAGSYGLRVSRRQSDWLL